MRHQRALGRTVGVLSIDPSSPFRGGALLGDRIRLSEHFLDPGVFIRSMATRGALGGMAEAALQAALLMDAAGKDDVYLETVGVGQAEVDVIDHADTVVLVLIPGSGDSIQALKAGVMEIPDVIVVNKCRPPADGHDGARDPRRAVARARRSRAGACRSSRRRRRRGEGVEELAERLAEHRAHRRGGGAAGGAPAAQPAQRGARARDGAPAARARGVAAATIPRSRSCSTRSSRAGSTRPRRRAACSSARASRAPDRRQAPTGGGRRDHSAPSNESTVRST